MRSHPPGIDLVGRAPDAILFHRPGGSVTAGAFLCDAHALAARLPPGAAVLNLCRDRYAFALAFAAALLRGRTCLLLGEVSSATLEHMRACYPDSTVVHDDPAWTGLGTLAAPSGVRDGTAPNPAIPFAHPAALVFTSGSTGAPVAHAKAWGTLALRSEAAGLRFALRQDAPAAVLGTVPPQHMYGFETTILLPLHAPASSWCGPAFFPGDVQAGLAALPAPRILVTTPLQMRALLPSRLPPLQACISATAPLDPALAAAASAAWSVPVHEIFGATEAGSIASRVTLLDQAWSLYPGLSLSAEEDAAVVHAPGTGPVALADIIEPLGSAQFRLIGRRSDVVKLAGRRASLAGLNQILLGLDGVADGAFVVPDDLDERSTARLSAVVVAPARSADAIVAALRDRIDPVFLPRRVLHVDRLPRNELGKLPRQALLALLAQP